MKITRLELKNFRSAQGLTLPTDARRVLVVGVNGAGKTSIRESVRWALRGICDGTDGKGNGAEVLVPVGENNAQVALDIVGIGTVQRTFVALGGSSFTVEGFTGTSAVQAQALLQKLNVSPAFLDACLETDAFLRLHHADAKALVLSLLNVRVDISSIQLAERPATLDELDALYKQAFEQRKDAKRTLTLVPTVAKPAVPPDYARLQERCGDRDPIEAVISLLSELREKRASLERSVGETVGQRKSLEAEWTRLQSLIDAGVPQDDGAGEAIHQMREELAKLTGVPLPMSSPQPLSATAQLKTRAQTLAEHMPSRGCVLDGLVPCKTPLKAFRERAEALQAEIAAVPTEGMSGRDRTAVRDLERQIQTAVDTLKANERTRAAYSAAHLRLPELKAAADALPETEPQEAEIEDLKKRIARGEQVLGEARTYVQALQQHEQMKAQRAALETQIAELETRVEMLGPKGLRVVALSEAMGRFEAAINRATEAWGWQVQIVVEPWTVLANGRPVETYSRSERYRLGIAVQLAVAELSGLSFAIVDELDMLDAPNRSRLLKMIDACPLEQVFVLTTFNEGAELPAAREGWAFLRLAQQDGRSVLVEDVRPQLQEA